MKLYTEEELRKHLYNHSDEFFEQLTPIELPSHYEVWEEAIKEELNQRRYDFMRGADWMRDKIKGGKK
jgi:hypothetical protein